MFELQPVSRQHESAILAFEADNRGYFAKSISDRGDSFFAAFPERHKELIAEQEAGVSAYYVLLDEHDAVVGRFNLYDISDGTATVGYRVAEHVSGRGVATSALESLCQIAKEQLGLRTLKAVVSDENVASQRVLLKAGFEFVESIQVAGRRGALFGIDLATL